MEKEKPIICIGLPHRGASVSLGAAFGWLKWPSRNHQHIAIDVSTSLLAYSFNILWATALNMRRSHGVTHFAMLHDDITPARYWVDTLMAEMQAYEADVVSTVIPLKSALGLTSTGIESHDIWKPRRLTMQEIARLPETFSIADTDQPGSQLLINTGCFLVNLQRPWCDQVAFHMRDAIIRDKEGTYTAVVQPEDWVFSRYLAEYKCRVFATRKVRVQHIGEQAYENWGSWGKWKQDQPQIATIGAIGSLSQ